MATTEEQVAACWRLMHDTLAFLPHFDAISALWTHLLAFPERLELMTTGKGPDGEEYDDLGRGPVDRRDDAVPRREQRRG